MTRKKTGSSPTSEDNRREARRAGFTGTKKAREAGKYLPDAATRKATKKSQDDAALEGTRPKIDPKKKADDIIKRGGRK